MALGNILLSAVLVTDGLIFYKTYRLLALGEEWTAHLSIHSLGEFSLCALGLTVLFSLVFALRATQVQVVDYLKD